MGKASLLQEKRNMVFEEACGIWTERRLTQEDAAELLGFAPGRSGAGPSAARRKGSTGFGTGGCRGRRTARRRWTR